MLNQHRSFHWLPYVLLCCTVLFWSANMVTGRGVRADVPPIALNFWRWAIAFILTLPFALPHLATHWRALLAKWPVLLLLAIVGIAGFNSFAYQALQYTAATNAILLNSFIPIATMAISWAFLGKTLRRWQALGAIVSLCGIFIIVSQGRVANLLALEINRGDLWMLAAVLTWAIYTVALQWRPAVPPLLLLSVLALIGLIVLLPAYAWEIASGKTIHLHRNSYYAIAYVGIFPSFLGYIFYNAAVEQVGANQASLFIHLMPVFGTLLSVIFLNEVPQLFHIAGIGFIFFGIYLATWFKRTTIASRSS